MLCKNDGESSHVIFKMAKVAEEISDAFLRLYLIGGFFLWFCVFIITSKLRKSSLTL